MFLKTVGAHHREGPVLSALPLLRRHGGDGGATVVLVRYHGGYGGATAVMAVPRRSHCGLAQPAVALRKF